VAHAAVTALDKLEMQPIVSQSGCEQRVAKR
jgi:hypothetical protein